MELGTHEGSRARARLGEAAAQLAARARAQGLPLGSVEAPGPTVERAVKLLRDELLTELEATCEATRRRAIDRRELPPVDEWREWLVIRARYERLASLAGLEARRLAWPKVRDDVCKLSVWLWNTREEKTIAHAMFRWLLAEATELGDQEAIELQQKANVGLRRLRSRAGASSEPAGASFAVTPEVLYTGERSDDRRRRAAGLEIWPFSVLGRGGAAAKFAWFECRMGPGWWVLRGRGGGAEGRVTLDPPSVPTWLLKESPTKAPVHPQVDHGLAVLFPTSTQFSPSSPQAVKSRRE